VEATAFTEHHADPEELAAALADVDVVVVMRERTQPTVLATPHLGHVALDNYRMYYREAVEDIAAFLAGTPIRTLS
jgi:phosphoglycerate dehydrogenase-like enzyme